MIKSVTAALIAITAIATIAAGCGSGKGSDSTGANAAAAFGAAAGSLTVGSLTKAQYIVKANMICRHLRRTMLKRLDSYRLEHRSDATSEERLFEEVGKSSLIPAIQFQVDDLRYVRIPRGDKRQVEVMLVTMQQGVDKSEKQQIASAEQLAAIFGNFNRLAHRYGIDGCIVRASSFAG